VHDARTRMKKLVILVEDDDAILLTVKRILESEGYVVLISQHADELMEKLDLMRPALILLPIKAIVTDIQMLGNGKEIMKLISADPDFKNIPIVPMSASEETLIFGKKVLKKPFTIKQVIKAIEDP
jgi:CheY-like chemotaxis protein